MKKPLRSVMQIVFVYSTEELMPALTEANVGQLKCNVYVYGVLSPCYCKLERCLC